jgi:uncharacterized damage-inducible protein DinB
MEPTDTLGHLFRHNLWANLRLLEHCEALTSEQMGATIPGSRGSLHDTLQHIANSERSYFSRVSTGQPYRHPADAPPMTIAEMSESLRFSGSGLIEWAPKVGDGDTVEVDWDGTPRKVPKSIILNQVINHATEHREQVKAILTELGIEPPDLSGWEYFEQGAG